MRRKDLMAFSILASVCYTIGWFWCVLFGIQGQSLVAFLGAAALLGFQLYYEKKRDTRFYIQDLLLVIFSIPLGILFELIYIHSGLLAYSDGSVNFPPIWITSLYPLFAMLINHSLRIIKTSYLLSFVTGCLGAPLSYLAGHSLGGVTFGYPLFESCLLIGISWGVYLALLVKLANLIEKATLETIHDRDSAANVKLLFDGECPLCSREICMLKQRTTEASVNFVDISSKEYAPKVNANIDYHTAMTQMHAIDAQGKPLMGISAFALIYARCQLLVISTLMRLPFMVIILNPFYALFAKYRVRIAGKLDRFIKKIGRVK